MKEKIKKALKVILLGFLILFFGRWFYLYLETQKDPGFTPTNTITFLSPFSMFELGSIVEGNSGGIGYLASRSRAGGYHNYANEQLSMQVSGVVGTPHTVQQEAIYEKVASLGSYSHDFDNDNQKIRASIQAHKARIQQEENYGLKDARQLSLTLGVVPDHFEALVEELRKVGTLTFFEMTKTEKTSDYLALRAKRASLAKQRTELEALKHVGGKMADLLSLQQRIFDIGNKIQDLGVEIGHFEGEAGLCTVVVGLMERGPGPSTLGLAGDALEWALWTCLSLLFFLLLGAVVVYLVIRVGEKILALPQMLSTYLLKPRRAKVRRS